MGRARGLREPHVALYEDATEVDGLRFPAHLAFRDWSEASGPTGDVIGRATFADVRVVQPAPGAVERPAGAAEDPLP